MPAWLNPREARLSDPAGSLVEFLNAAHEVKPQSLLIIHIEDEHKKGPDDEHLERFGMHALKLPTGSVPCWLIRRWVYRRREIRWIQDSPGFGG